MGAQPTAHSLASHSIACTANALLKESRNLLSSSFLSCHVALSRVHQGVTVTPRRDGTSGPPVPPHTAHPTPSTAVSPLPLSPRAQAGWLPLTCTSPAPSAAVRSAPLWPSTSPLPCRTNRRLLLLLNPLRPALPLMPRQQQQPQQQQRRGTSKSWRLP